MTNDFNENLIILNGLEGNSPAGVLNSSQKIIAPYVNEIIIFWWSVWVIMFCIALFNFVIVPMWKNRKNKITKIKSLDYQPESNNNKTSSL